MSNYKMFPKRFHSYIRSKKVDGLSVGPLQKTDGSLTAVCGEMAKSFSSVYVTENPVLPAPHQVCDGVLDHIPLLLSDVVNKLSAVDAGSSMEPDGGHLLLLRSYSFLVIPLY